MKHRLNRSFYSAPRKLSFPVLALGLALAACASGTGGGEDVAQVSLATGTAGAGGAAACKSTSLALLDLHGDVRELWKGLEQPETGKQAEPNLTVTLDFNATVTASSIASSFVPTATDGSCGNAVAATSSPAVVPADVWGQLTSDTARQALPSAFNLFVRDQISGLVSAGGPIAAGKDVTLSSLSVNGTVREPVGLIAGGKVTLSSGSVAGNVTYGVASTFPQTVSITGTKSLLPFDPAAAFGKLEALSTLLDEIPLTGSATLANGTLTLSGTKSGVNSFRIAADQLRQATTILISAPTGAGILIGTSGSAVDLQNKGISLSGVTAASVLWNFPAAGSVSVNSTTVQGSILAPRARFEFGNGGINGTVVARSFVGSGSGSFQHTPLNVTTLLGTAAPSSIALTPAQPLQRGCTYRLAIPSTTPLTAAGACLGTPFGVTFRVAPHLSTPAGRELIHVERDLKTGMLRRFSAKTGVNTSISDVWARYESAPGVSATELVPVGSPTKSTTVATETVQPFQQYTQGYPVIGFGYFVASENGMFRSANGRVMPSIPSLPQPSISAATALQNVLTYLKVSPAPWVAKPTTYQAPTGTLVVAPTRPLPGVSDFVLVWTFQLGGKTGIDGSTSITVDAVSGAVRSDNPSQLPAALNTLAKAVGPTLGASVTTAYYGSITSPEFTTTDYKNPNGSTVAALTNGDVFAPALPPGLIATTTGVYKDSTGTYTGTESFLIDPTPSTPWVTVDPLEQGVASAQWALERADSFMKTLNLSLNQQPWTVADGTGTRPVLLNYVDPTHVWPTMSQAFFRTSGGETGKLQLFVRDEGLTLGVDIMAHEYAHGLFASARRAAGLTNLINHRESASILEGLGDLFTIAFNQQHQDLVSSWYCYTSESPIDGRECLENTRQPYLSILDKGQPEYYHGDHYQDYIDYPDAACNDPKGDTDNCGAHTNSTMVSHWGYLLAAGTHDLPSVPCDLNLDPVATDPAAGLRLAVELSMGGVQRIGAVQPTQNSEATFFEFRDATLQIAQEGLKSSPPLYKPEDVAKVELAWAAMGLPTQEATQSHVEPPDGAEYVNPWTVFTWPASDFAKTDGTSLDSWDFQIADGPFDTNLKYEVPAITTTVVRNGVNVPSVSVSLPFDTTTNFYWRVRPHSTDATWLGCYPVHSFKGTSHPAPVGPITFPYYQTDDVPPKLRPGTVIPAWAPVDGAASYELFISPTADPNCAVSGDVVKQPYATAPDSTLMEFYILGIQPLQDYYVSVRPIGPPDFSGTPSVGPSCTKATFTTAAMRAPTFPLPPDDGVFHPGYAPVDGVFPFNGKPPPYFVWEALDGPEEYRMEFHKIIPGASGADVDGTCAPAIETPLTKIVWDPCAYSTCTKTLEDQPFAGKNPSGYCMYITSIAKNGKESEKSEPIRFFFTYNSFQAISPGVQISHAANGETVIVGKKFGDPVTFSWQPDPNATQYVLKVAPWPLNLEGPWDPPNCVSAFPPVGSKAPALNSKGIPCGFMSAGDTARKLTTKTTQQMSGDEAGKGRYCWWSFPVTGAESGPQALVNLYPEFCYRSHAATPKILVGDPPVEAPDLVMVRTGTSVTGVVHSDYVPDWQIGGEFSSGTGQWKTDRCVSKSPLYADVLDCNLDFTFSPDSPEGYADLTIHTWDSDAHPPDKDDAHKQPDISTRFVTCGGEPTTQTSACCDDGNRCNAGYVCRPPGGRCNPSGTPVEQAICNKGSCETCGGHGNYCCDGNVENECNDPADDCWDASNGGTGCATCGHLDDYCPCRHTPCPDGTACFANHCKVCGKAGAPCCDGAKCGASNLKCDSASGKCERCGEVGDDCCDDGKCRASNAKCDGNPAGAKCTSCGQIGQDCCDNSKCTDANSACDASTKKCINVCTGLQAPALGSLRQYHQYCVADGGTQDLAGVTFDTCDVTDPVSKQIVDPFVLVQNGTIPCVENLEFLWTYPADACLDHFRVDAFKYPGWQTVEDNKNAGKTTAFRDGNVHGPNGGADLIALVVRAVDEHGALGPAIIGMEAVSPFCHGNSPPTP